MGQETCVVRDPKNVAVRGLKTKNGKKASCDKLKRENLT